MEQDTKTFLVTENELSEIRKYFYAKYPWLCKGNTIYSASPADLWELEIGERDFKEIEHILQPCDIVGF